MATAFKHCSVDGCNNNAHYTKRGALGMCNAHYLRSKKFGDPKGGGTFVGEPLGWLKSHSNVIDSECLIWPYSNYPSGYGQIRYEGRSQKASRVMCTLVHGAPPRRGMEAAHSCGNGHLGCVNPSHIRWDTPKGNCADRAEHGTENRGTRQWMAKLKDEDVRDIRAKAGQMYHRDIARLHGVSRMTVTDIVNRRTWAWLE